jgi:hypothetical protein
MPCATIHRGSPVSAADVSHQLRRCDRLGLGTQIANSVPTSGVALWTNRGTVGQDAADSAPLLWEPPISIRRASDSLATGTVMVNTPWS